MDDTNFPTLDEIVGSSQDLVREVPIGLSGGIKSDSQLVSLSHILETLKKEEAEFNNHRNKIDSDEFKNDPHLFGISVPASLRISKENNVVPLFEAQDHKKFLSGLETFKQRDFEDTNKFDNLYFLHQTSSSHSEHSQGKVVEAGNFSSSHPSFDVVSVRKDFPILQETVNGRPLIWFDNAATTQKPSSVIERIKYFYEHENSNIHRAAHEMAARATDAYEEARSKVAKFIGANSKNEIIFTRGATEAINLVAATLGQVHLSKDDEILITHLEHHANIVPWQQLALSKGAKIKVAPVDDNGVLLLEEFGRLLTNKTKLVSFTHVSNALGTITPAKTLIEMAHKVGAYVLVDGAQSVSHMKVNVQELNADFFVFSGHKLFAPTGIGVLYGKKQILERLPPYQTGGNMIKDVTFERTVFNGSPERFEAGTGNIADAVGLGAAIDYVEKIGLDNIARYEHELLIYATEKICQIPNLKIIGRSPEKASLISFVIEGISSEEIGAKLNGYGIAVRSGHHCAQPILRRYNFESTVRPSFAFYNTFKEIDELVSALKIIAAETSFLSS
ncbi:MAG: family 2A encapsulin nanocompartment cargo protein cysteine desulfurase [Hyphomicrobium sp.]